jgi:hypothetical protein
MNKDTRYLIGSVWTPEEFKKFQEWLRVLLRNGVVTVNFTKKDGTERIMNCTTSEEYLPEVKVVQEGAEKKERKMSIDTHSVFDMDAKAWKSFRWDSIKSVTFNT